MAALTREETEALIQEVLEVYPEKAKKDRAKHLMVNDKELESSKKCITSNRSAAASIPAPAAATTTSAPPVSTPSAK